MVRGYIYLGRYVFKYLLDVTGGMIIREGTFIWQKIVAHHNLYSYNVSSGVSRKIFILPNHIVKF